MDETGKTPEQRGRSIQQTGFYAMVGGFIVQLFFMFVFSTTHEGFNNLGLLNTRQNGMIIGGSVMVTGAILLIGGRRAVT